MADTARRKFIPRPDRPVTAVQLALDTDGLVYRKWGGEQRAKPNDWLVNNAGEVYTVDASSFAATYRPIDPVAMPGLFVKTTPVWAVEATIAGAVATREGQSHYEAGDFIVSNNPNGDDSYAVARDTFHGRYVAAPAEPE